MNHTNSRNAKVLLHFGLAPEDDAGILPWNSGPEPYMNSGSHPDIVERLWKQIGAALPEDCRCRVGRTPALAHPRTRLVFGLTMGTQYALRLPPALVKAAIDAGAKTTTVWGLKRHFDLSAALGAEWVFGAWLKQELEWCRRAYDAEDAA